MRFEKMIYELKETGELNCRDFISFIISIIALILISIQSISIGRNSILIGICFLVASLSILFSNYCAIISKKEVVGSKLQNEELKVKNNNLIEITDNIRCFKHDFNNIIQAIDGYMIVKDMNSLQKYIDSLIEECDRTNIMDVLNEQISKSPAICGVLINKLKVAETKNIKMNVEIFSNLEAFNEKSYVVSRILGILLDNAIEASGSCKEKKIVNIRFSSESCKNKNSIIIENTYVDKELDTEKIFEKNYSTKIGNSGLGLWKVKDILKKDSSFSLLTTKDDNVFKQELDVYNFENKVTV